MGLQFVLVAHVNVYEPDEHKWMLTRMRHEIDVDVFICSHCHKEHARIHVAYRRPVGMLGQYVLFRYNGEEHAPDLSVPIGVTVLPRDAQPMSAADCERYWHS